MPLTRDDIDAIQALLAPVVGREAWGVHAGYGARLTVNFGTGTTKIRTTRSGRVWSTTRGEWQLWTAFDVWRLEDETGVLAAYEDPRPVMDPAVERLNGHRLLSVEVSPRTLDTTFTFDGGLILRLFPVYMDPESDYEHWMLFAPSDNLLVLGPGLQWSHTKSNSSPSAVATRDDAIARFEALCEGAWPCVIDAFELRRAASGDTYQADLTLRLRPQDPDDRRRITLLFHGVAHLEFAQSYERSEGAGLDYLSISSVRNRGWDGIAYDVHDPGQHYLTFYCASFDVLVDDAIAGLSMMIK